MASLAGEGLAAAGAAGGAAAGAVWDLADKAKAAPQSSRHPQPSCGEQSTMSDSYSQFSGVLWRALHLMQGRCEV